MLLQQIYWTDGGRNSIEVAELDGNNRKVLVWTGLGNLLVQTSDLELRRECCAIFTFCYTIYFFIADIRCGTQSIRYVDVVLTSNNFLHFTDSPRAIALHYEEGYLFWSDWGQSAKIERADMDGKNR